MGREGAKKNWPPQPSQRHLTTALKMKQEACFLASWLFVIRNGIAEVAICDGK